MDQNQNNLNYEIIDQEFENHMQNSRENYQNRVFDQMQSQYEEDRVL